MERGEGSTIAWYFYFFERAGTQQGYFMARSGDEKNEGWDQDGSAGARSCGCGKAVVVT